MKLSKGPGRLKVWEFLSCNKGGKANPCNIAPQHNPAQITLQSQVWFPWQPPNSPLSIDSPEREERQQVLLFWGPMVVRFTLLPFEPSPWSCKNYSKGQIRFDSLSLLTPQDVYNLSIRWPCAGIVHGLFMVELLSFPIFLKYHRQLTMEYLVERKLHRWHPITVPCWDLLSSWVWL